ncbi:kininogen-1 [Drosophila sechellia]|uniref:GM21265 n=1 Tax=Drosophila sechellia TaxID=7238 RepID=B4HN55_DROSE|nr:kininogen-1 [Drosophila sechellia]EDW47359.1 GM21265 [Drosophila sechellia]
MRVILLSIVGLLCLAYALALNEYGADLEDLANLGAEHAESGVREARGYGHGNYGHGNYGHGNYGHGHHGGGGHGHGHYGR